MKATTSGFSEEEAQEVINSFLKNVRQYVVQHNLNDARLPGWIKAAKVRAGWINESLVAVFEDAVESDIYEMKGAVSADTVILLNMPDFLPKGASLPSKKANGLILLAGTYGDSLNPSIINLVSERPALFNCGYSGYHSPIGLSNLFFQYRPGGKEAEVLESWFVPFAIYIHRDDTKNSSDVWKLCEQNLTAHLAGVHDSALGDFYQSQYRRPFNFSLDKQFGVVVLGKDSGAELNELQQVQQTLRSRGYKAILLKEMPDVPEMSNEEKVRLWALASRFCVMIDREPSGHIFEYGILKDQRSILAMLRPQGQGSTYMIGDDGLVDLNYLRVFHYDQSPLTVLDDVIVWAEEIARKRSEAYDKHYPWREK